MIRYGAATYVALKEIKKERNKERNLHLIRYDAATYVYFQMKTNDCPAAFNPSAFKVSEKSYVFYSDED